MALQVFRGIRQRLALALIELIEVAVANQLDNLVYGDATRRGVSLSKITLGRPGD